MQMENEWQHGKQWDWIIRLFVVWKTSQTNFVNDVCYGRKRSPGFYHFPGLLPALLIPQCTNLSLAFYQDWNKTKTQTLINQAKNIIVLKLGQIALFLIRQVPM